MVTILTIIFYIIPGYLDGTIVDPITTILDIFINVDRELPDSDKIIDPKMWREEVEYKEKEKYNSIWYIVYAISVVGVIAVTVCVDKQIAAVDAATVSNIVRAIIEFFGGA